MGTIVNWIAKPLASAALAGVVIFVEFHIFKKACEMVVKKKIASVKKPVIVEA